MPSYTVAQNTSFLTAASVLQKIISFVYFTVIARLIGVGNTGEYFFAIAFTTIFTVVADFGLAPVLTRETAKYPERAEEFINTVIGAKLIFGLLSYLLVILAVNVLNYPDSVKILVYVSGVTMFFDNLHSGFYSIFRGRKNLIYEAVGVVGSQLITLVIGTFALLNHWPLVWLILAYTIPSCLNAVYSGLAARKVFALRYNLSFNRAVFKMFFALAVPFALAGIIGRLYSYSDSLLMSKMLSRQELGWWSVPYKITFAFQFIPAALSASVYPAMSALTLSEPSRVGELFAKSCRYLFTIVFPLAFGLIVLAQPIITYLYTKNYAPSAPVLQILMVSLIFGFLGLVTGPTLNAINRQKIQTGLMAAALIANVIANLLLLPRLGIIGAAWSALLGNAVLFAGGLYFVSRHVQINFNQLSAYFLRTFLPALAMGAAVYYLSREINFLLTIPIGGIIYAFLLFMSGGIDKKILGRIITKLTINN